GTAFPRRAPRSPASPRTRGIGPSVASEYVRDGAEIYRRSFATIRAEADLARFPADLAPVVVGMIHACGMVDLARDVAASAGVVTRARAALQGGAPILCDAQMV